MGDSDTHSQIQPRQGGYTAQGERGSNYDLFGGGAVGAGANIGNITEIGTVEVAGSRRSGRFAGGGSNTSQNSNQQRPVTGKSGPFRGPDIGRGYGDVLDNEMSRDPMAGRRDGHNMLSDVGSKYGEDQDDRMSYFQSDYGGISNIGADNPDQPQTRQSRRREVAARTGINLGDDKKERLPPKNQPQQKGSNYGLFLGGSYQDKTSDAAGRSKSEHRPLGEQGMTIGSTESGA